MKLAEGAFRKIGRCLVDAAFRLAVHGEVLSRLSRA